MEQCILTYVVSINTDINGYCNVFNNISKTSKVSFTNNPAAIAGNSIYFNIPKSCQIITDIPYSGKFLEGEIFGNFGKNNDFRKYIS